MTRLFGFQVFKYVNPYFTILVSYLISCVHLNLSSKLALESRLRTHHSCKSVRFKQLICIVRSQSSTLRINLNERTIRVLRTIIKVLMMA
jgi:hypothetical protein